MNIIGLFLLTIIKIFHNILLINKYEDKYV
jgi:hypothetical protein